MLYLAQASCRYGRPLIASIKCIKMNRSLSLIIILASFQAAADESVKIEGLLSWNKDHFAEVTDCATGNKYAFGVMTSTRYFDLLKKSEELSKNGAVLITVEGKINNNNIISHPLVLSINNGGC